jgi:hypothetical protein
MLYLAHSNAGLIMNDPLKLATGSGVQNTEIHVVLFVVTDYL